MVTFIKVPQKIVGIKFLDTLLEQTEIGYEEDNLFHRKNKSWYVSNEEDFNSALNIFDGHLDPINGQLVLGLEEIAKDYNHSIDTDSEISKGNILGGVYSLTEEDIKTSLVSNEICIGKVSHPLAPATLCTHRMNKNNLMKPEDRVVCTQHSGYRCFGYQLLHYMKPQDIGQDMEEGDWIAVKGMDFLAHALSGNPIQLIKIQYVLQADPSQGLGGHFAHSYRTSPEQFKVKTEE